MSFDANVRRYSELDELVKKANKEKRELMAEIEDHMYETGLPIAEVISAKGKKIVVKRKNGVKKVVDKDGLSKKLGVPKKDLTMENMMKWAEEGKITSSELEKFISNQPTESYGVKTEKAPRAKKKAS